MPLSKTIKRELEVAFSKDAQPVWFRIVKYILLGSFVLFFVGNGVALDHLTRSIRCWYLTAFLVQA